MSFSVNDCNFTNNVSYQGGSGVYLFESNASFSNCVFHQNTTISTGSGAKRTLRIPTLRSVDLFSIQMMLTIMEAPFAVMIRI